MKIRPAALTDLPAIAAIHLKGWELAYGAFIPADQLAAMQPHKRLPLWRDWLSQAEKLILVGSVGDGIDGFLLGGPVKEHNITKGDLAGFDCEIYSLHCRAHVQGKGLGRNLIAAAAAYWLREGKRALMLWAYSDNAYRRFYEKIGGQLIAEGIDGGVPDIAYGWRDLSKLIGKEAEQNIPSPYPLPQGERT